MNPAAVHTTQNLPEPLVRVWKKRRLKLCSPPRFPGDKHCNCCEVSPNGSGDTPALVCWCLPDRWDVYWGAQVRGLGLGVEPEAEFFLLNPSVTPLPSPPSHPPPSLSLPTRNASSVRALLAGRETLGAALPHLGPNAHCGIVLASGDRRVG